MQVLVVLGWLVVGVLAALAVSLVLRLDLGAAVALAQDGIVHGLALAWVVLVAAALTRHWSLAAAAGLLSAAQLVLVVPRAWVNRLPHWVDEAPRLDLLVSNVFVGNETPGALARVLLDEGADVIVITEWNPVFVDAFDVAGGRAAYPHRVFDPGDASAYAVGVLARRPFAADSRMDVVGPLPVARVVLDVGGLPVTILGVHAMAAVEPGGFALWQRQIDALTAYAPSFDHALVVAGDLNATTHRPRLRALLATGLTDAHDALGRGLSASFKLAVRGPLAAAGPVARLDHALTNHGLRAISTRDLPSAGSDHLPFVVTLAVRPERRRRVRAGRARSGGRPVPPSS